MRLVNKSVGIGDISNLVDDCEAVSADGFLLACSTQPSSAVVKRLEEIEVKGKIKTHFWDAVEIEKRLNTPQGYPLIHLFFPDSSKSWSALYKENIKYLTVHDAILIDPKDLIVAKSHFERILKEEFDYLPKVKVTQLSPKKAIAESEKKKEQLDEAA